MSIEKPSAFQKAKQYVLEHKVETGIFAVIFLYITGLVSLGTYYLVKLPLILNGEMKNPFTLNPIFVFKDLFTHIRGYVFIIIMALVVVLVYRLVLYPRMKEERGKYDERGFRVLTEEGKYGTAELLTDPNELGDVIDYKPVSETKGVILGKALDSDTTSIKINTDVKKKGEVKVISCCDEQEYNEKAKRNNWNIDDIVNNKLNNHIAVFGASGTMKSRALARNLIMQDALRGESIIVTDPKGELYEDCAPFLRAMGYDVKMFNLVNQGCSDSWNCLSEIFDENGCIDSTSAKIFADTIVMNATSEKDYWSDNARNLLKATCLYVLEACPKEEQNMGKVYDIISSSTTTDIDIMFRSLEDTSVAKRAYNIFGVCTEQVKGQILNGLGIMLDIFQDDAIRNITTSEEINLSKPATEKCAYFCITSDQHSVFDFLIVVFYAMLFVKLVNRVDSLRHDESIKTIPINLVMDEFPNIGQVPAFCKKISTVRSRNINITIIFQNIVQLQNRYPLGQWEEILGNCDTTIFLGCTDETTAKYISDKTGIATIEVETQNTKYERDVLVFNQNTSYNEVRSAGQRKVLNPDEVLTLKNTEELIFLRGKKPLKAKKYDYTLHPLAQQLKSQPITSHIPEWKQKQIDEALEAARLRKEREEEAKKRQEEELKAIKEQQEKEKQEQAQLAGGGIMNAMLRYNSKTDSVKKEKNISKTETEPKTSASDKSNSSSVNDTNKDNTQSNTTKKSNSLSDIKKAANNQNNHSDNQTEEAETPVITKVPKEAPKNGVPSNLFMPKKPQNAKDI